MDGKGILRYIFDQKTYNDIMEFCERINNSDADFYVVMSRKAACFVSFLEKYDFLKINGSIVTDRILDFNNDVLINKNVIVIDDVVVSGTTIYNVIRKLKNFKVANIEVFILGVNSKYFNTELFSYQYNDEIRNYINGPYVLMTDEGCTYMCSNIAKVFALDASPYDVDFPKHNIVSVSKDLIDQMVFSSYWRSYDVSSSMQSDFKIRNITFLPSEELIYSLKNRMGECFFSLGYIKIRLFVKYAEDRKKKYKLNAIPYFMFNEISEDKINIIFNALFSDWCEGDINSYAKLRILQYVFAEKVFLIWNDLFDGAGTNVNWELNKIEFSKIFPIGYYDAIIKAIYSEVDLKKYFNDFLPLESYSFDLDLKKCNKNEDYNVFLQAKLVEPFTNLYFNKELKAREIVKKHGKDAFALDEYKDVFYRLNHGNSYKSLLKILDKFPDVYDKETTVSLFIDKAIDSGVIVPIIAEEIDNNNKKIFYRAFRHGEDIPFGEHQEKMCAILLSNYKDQGGIEALSKIRIEKLLVLFLRIGELQKIFRLDTYDSIYYKVSVDAYLFGNIPSKHDLESCRNIHYIKHKSDVVWLTDVLKEKQIIKIDSNGKVEDIDDTIDIAIDRVTKGQVSIIGQTFGKLFYNYKLGQVPYIDDHDFILFSTCLFPQDVLNALAAELAIFNDRFSKKVNIISNKIENEKYVEVYELINSNEFYTSINSGQKKYFDFINKNALRRIEEISIQLANRKDLSVYGSAWDQFWPNNLDWNESSIERTLLDTIYTEAKLILILNVLCREMLFCVCLDDKKKSELHEQINIFIEKLKKQKFSNHRGVKKIMAFSCELFESVKQIPDRNVIFKILDNLCFYNKLIPNILSDVDLLINKHGKVNEIIRYNHALCIMPECNYDLFGKNFRQLLKSKNISYQEFPIFNSNAIFPEAGIWFFLKGKNKQDLINQVLVECLSKGLPEYNFEYAKVYYNLSEELKLKISGEENARKRFCSFPSYSKQCLEQIEGISRVRGGQCIYWLIEDCKANEIFKNRVKSFINSAFDLIENGTIRIQTMSSQKSLYYVMKYNNEKRKQNVYNKLRKRYDKMSEKCKVFISYSEDSEEHVNRVKRIADHLKEADMDVYFYGDELFGTDIIEFMRNIEKSDVTLIIGTEEYKKRVYGVCSSGSSFEDRIIASGFMSEHRSKIVPIAFGKFNEVIPAPFNVLKGMTMTTVTEDELDKLTLGLINKYIKNN